MQMLNENSNINISNTKVYYNNMMQPCQVLTYYISDAGFYFIYESLKFEIIRMRFEKVE